MGPNPEYPRTGGYVANGAFVAITSNATLGKRLGQVAGSARRGDNAVLVSGGMGLSITMLIACPWLTRGAPPC